MATYFTSAVAHGNTSEVADSYRLSREALTYTLKDNGVPEFSLCVPGVGTFSGPSGIDLALLFQRLALIVLGEKIAP